MTKHEKLAAVNREYRRAAEEQIAFIKLHGRNHIPTMVPFIIREIEAQNNRFRALEALRDRLTFKVEKARQLRMFWYA